MKRTPGAESRAFTLLEVLLSMAIFSMVVIGIYNSQQFVVRAIAVSRRGYDPYRDLLRLERILPGLLMSASAGSQRNEKAIFRGEKHRLVFTTLNDLQFSEGSSPLQYVSVELKDEGGLTLTRNPVRFLYEETDDEADSITTFPTVSSFEIDYYDEQDRFSEWDARKKGTLPIALLLKTGFKDSVNNELLIERIIPLPVKPEIPITTSR